MTGTAWVAYLPLPGLHVVAARSAPSDRLTRFHALQGGTVVLGTYVLVLALGFLSLASDAKAFQDIIGLVTGVVLVAYLVQAIRGMVAVGRDRFVRLWPWANVLTLLRR